MARLEADISKQIKNRLEIWQLTGNVIWWARLNTGKIRTEYGKYVQLCPEGTPDFVALIRGKQDEVQVLFIECKSDTGKLSPKQAIFAEKYNKIKYFKVILVRNIAFLDSAINTIEKNLVEEMKSPGF